MLQRVAAQVGIITTPASFLSDPLLRSSLAAAAYDSVWALAIAYHNSVKQNLTFEVDNIIAEMKMLSFRGTAVSRITAFAVVVFSVLFVYLERPQLSKFSKSRLWFFTPGSPVSR